LFRELSKLIVAYGTRVLSLGTTHPTTYPVTATTAPRPGFQRADASARKRHHSEMTATNRKGMLSFLLCFSSYGAWGWVESHRPYADHPHVSRPSYFYKPSSARCR
jgi:hypothetical protein